MLASRLQNHYLSRVKFKTQMKKEKGFDAHLHELYDAKMMCNLAQNSKWTRKHHPFLLCKRKMGEAIIKWSTHKCGIMSDSDYTKHCKRSEMRFRSNFHDDLTPANVKKHRDYCDKNNFSVTYFGFQSSLLSLSSIEFDIMCCCSSIVRSMMD